MLPARGPLDFILICLRFDDISCRLDMTFVVYLYPKAMKVNALARPAEFFLQKISAAHLIVFTVKNFLSKTRSS